MKKILLIALFAMLLTGMSVTASYAGCRPGCYCPTGGAGANGTNNYKGFFGAQENRANAMRLRDRAYERQIHHQNDNGPGMTCFDHAMALTTRLGQIFSDLQPKLPVPANNARVFGKATFPNYGNDQWLSTALNIVVKPTLQEHANDFKPDSLSDILGATDMLSWFTAAFMGFLNGIIGAIMGVVNQINSYVTTLNNLMTIFQQIVDMLNGMMPTWILGMVAAINAAWAAVQNVITSFIGTLMSTVGGFVNSIVGAIMGALGSMSSFGLPSAATFPPTPSAADCARIQNLWGAVGGGFPAQFMTGPIRALTGSGVQQGAPYFNYADLLSKIPPGTQAPGPGVGDLQTELGLAVNAPLVSQALNDLSNSLSGPGNPGMPMWTTPQVFGWTPPAAPNTNTLAIIGGM